MGTSLSTPGEPSRPSRWTCSRSPTAPITVSSSPREGCAFAPTDSIRSITAWISASEAVGFITIIIFRFLSYALEEYGRVDFRRSIGNCEGVRRRVASATERLRKSPGVGIRVAIEREGGAAGAVALGAHASAHCGRRPRPRLGLQGRAQLGPPSLLGPSSRGAQSRRLRRGDEVECDVDRVYR